MTNRDQNQSRRTCEASIPMEAVGPLGVIDWKTLRERLAASDGQQVWRSLDELTETPECFDYLHREFPRQASEWNDPSGRRHFLKLMAASLGLAGVGLSGCIRPPDEKIVPYVRQPEDMIPEKPQFFATCMTLGGYATGLLVEVILVARPRLKVTPNIQQASERQMSLLKLRSSHCMTRIVRRL